MNKFLITAEMKDKAERLFEFMDEKEQLLERVAIHIALESANENGEIDEKTFGFLNRVCEEFDERLACLDEYITAQKGKIQYEAGQLYDNLIDTGTDRMTKEMYGNIERYTFCIERALAQRGKMKGKKKSESF